jgi:2-polyprenyl-3-methyl-5-hydroxy-6-metoxy-1,4-benzoquinol methylase
MCHPSVLRFIEALPSTDVRGKDVLEVGAFDVNGSPWPILAAHGPRSYVGVDARPGPGVDEVCDASALVRRFGERRFDLVVSTEMLEHVEDWRAAVSNMKRVLRPRGALVLTTRSPGFPLHEFPGDFWRFTVTDMHQIFADCEILTIHEDPGPPGVFVKIVKPRRFAERDLSSLTVTAMEA